ncbi:collagen-like protein [Microbacterium sp. kSW2-24]|uniref:hypothetical protein n=1 Tax=Microbacterium galbinum TaxID=2851646 RepID=UPI002493707E|nr:hypothetical protein [Microbacterium galbinum]MCK2024072.1 collagen-like protein [Microbacterium galbinum]
MSEPDDLLNASIRERRRLVIVFTALIAVVAIALGVGWLSAWGGREAWHEQAMTWQDRYVELYDEFTVATGEEPDAPEPGVVAEQGPQGEPGSPGAPGPVGPAGPSGTPGPQGARGVPGDPGDDGEPGEPGAAGQQGQTGQSGGQGPAGATGPQGPKGDAGAPGPAGPQGPAGTPGPTCPDGYAAETRWISVSDSDIGIFYPQQAIVCIPTPTGGTP